MVGCRGVVQALFLLLLCFGHAGRHNMIQDTIRSSNAQRSTTARCLMCDSPRAFGTIVKRWLNSLLQLVSRLLVVHPGMQLPAIICCKLQQRHHSPRLLLRSCRLMPFLIRGRSVQVFATSHAPESGLVDQLEAAFQHEFGHKEDDSGCPDAYLMRKPFKAFDCTVLRPRKLFDTLWLCRKHSGGTSGAPLITMLVRAHTWSRP